MALFGGIHRGRCGRSIAFDHPPDRLAVDRRHHRLRLAGLRHPIDQRRRDAIVRRGVGGLGNERRQRCALAELDAGRVQPRRPVEVARQRDARVASEVGIADGGLWALQDRLDRHVRVGGNRDKRGVGAVLQEPSDKVGEQIAVGADRRVDPARGRRQFGEQRLVQHLPHAVEALEFVALGAVGGFDHARNRQRVVGAELRKQPRPRRQQLPHAGEIVEVGHRLSREHGIVGKTPLLRTLHLRVPIGALDQPHDQATVQGTGRSRTPVDHRRCALLIGLDRQPEALPARERWIGEHRADHLKLEFKPVRLLGIDREEQVVALRSPCEFEHPRHEFPQHAPARHRFEPRMQCRELYRNAGSCRQRSIARAPADRLDRAGVRLEVAHSVG